MSVLECSIYQPFSICEEISGYGPVVKELQHIYDTTMLSPKRVLTTNIFGVLQIMSGSLQALELI